MVSRREKQVDLLVALGDAVAPAREFARAGSRDVQLAHRLYAKMVQDNQKWGDMVNQFAKDGDLQYSISGEAGNVAARAGDLVLTLAKTGRWDRMLPEIDALVERTKAAILDLPVDDAAGIRDAKTPFSVFLEIRSIVMAATKRVDWIDPYPDSYVFYRYIRHIMPGVTATLVFDEKKRSQNKTEMQDFIGASLLYAQEFPHSYRLCSSNLHDRHLRVDDRIYHLGTSSPHAGAKTPFTMTLQPNTQAEHQKIDAYADTGIEWFGPTTKVHKT